MNEWDLQPLLKQRWVEHGLKLNGEQFFLCGEEVMSDWTTNDPQVRWNLPSIDYMFLDRHGQIWAFELKHRVSGDKDAWSLLSQVSHRALLLRKSFNQEALTGVYEALTASQSLAADHQRHFGLSSPISEFGNDGKIHRMVGALEYGDGFSDVLRAFERADLATVRDAVDGYSKASNKEFVRLADLDAREWSNVLGPVIRATKVFLDVFPHEAG